MQVYLYVLKTNLFLKTGREFQFFYKKLRCHFFHNKVTSYRHETLFQSCCYIIIITSEQQMGIPCTLRLSSLEHQIVLL